MSSEFVFGIVKEIVALVVVPVLLFVAWSQWVRNVRALLSPWRNGIALAALLIISLNWAAGAFLDTQEFLKVDASWTDGVRRMIYLLSHELDVAAVIFAIALKRAPRVEAALAGLLIAICWPGVYR